MNKGKTENKSTTVSKICKKLISTENEVEVLEKYLNFAP